MQTIATKYRREQETGVPNPNFMRQYYDVAALLDHPAVQKFIGTEAYEVHKKNRFPAKDYEIPISQNEAFTLPNTHIRKEFEKRYQRTSGLYYDRQPDFEELLSKIRKHISRL